MNGKILWLAIFFGVLIWSAVEPRNYFVWFLEVSPALIGFIVLAATRRRFPLTPLVYWLILIHSTILMAGAHYTYSEMPLFERLQEFFGWQRNHYDRVGHFAQGFVPAMIAREILIRNRVINGRGWLNFLILCFCLALSAFYELIEWWVGLLTGEPAAVVLAMQGDEWDTQSDMLMALLGAATALLSLGKLHDRQLAERPWHS